jgi:hypothetical protein
MTGKDRWRRVPKDYFKKPDQIQRAKLGLSALAAVAAVAWWAFGVDWAGRRPAGATDLNGLRANHGELNRAHAAWEDRCEACHVPFEPINGRPLLSSKSNPASRSSDQLCATCHAGPSHHATVKAEDEQSCAECHNDHQGRDFSLVRMDDARCTHCHAGLDAHRDLAKKKEGTKTYASEITGFATNHPDFKPEAADYKVNPPRDLSRLKFNHAQHMTPGIIKQKGDTPYTIGQILASEQDRYASDMGAKDKSDPVRLDCASCHVLDSTEVKGGVSPTAPVVPVVYRSPGKYFQPVNYQTQCRACHPLTFDPNSSPELSGLEAPHGVQPAEVIRFLRQTYAAEVVRENPAALGRFVPTSKIPGKAPDDETLQQKLDRSVNRALTFVFTGKTENNCVECHFIREKDGMPMEVEKTNVPDLWFTHAVFNHTDHRPVNCSECHARSYAFDPVTNEPVKDASMVATDVLIPGIKNCVECHSPAKSGGWLGGSGSAKPTGGVTHDCTECHTYHNGDNPLQGPGAKSELATELRSIEDFIAAPKKAKKP